jgi:hypothetical protein
MQKPSATCLHLASSPAQVGAKIYVMPTPFTHLVIAQRLLRDESVPQRYRDLLNAERSAFLLGNVAADARVGAGVPREVTHFYAYGDEIKQHPWRLMVDAYPTLMQPQDAAHRTFVAGYVAHLSVDEIWSKHMSGPNFAQREWADRPFRFYMLHIILIYMDERDLSDIEPWQAETLCTALPDGWLPFAANNDLCSWQTFIYNQIKDGGQSLTLQIFGERINKTPAEMRAFLDSPVQMQAGLWDHVPRDLLAEVETRMYRHARQQMINYLDETESLSHSAG